MSQYPRYAIYFVPQAHNALYHFGASLIGYDAYSGQFLPFAHGIETDVDGWKQFTNDPRKYGFHATLKAPFTLETGKTEDDLLTAMGEFVRKSRTVPVIAPTVRGIGNFIAIVPDAPSPELQTLAEDCVATFDHFRAPLTAADRARRNVPMLTDRQVMYLDRWGYPYVFEEFRFHMTLAGPLPVDRRAAVTVTLQRQFTELDLPHLAIDRLALFRQNDASSSFTVISDWPLQASD